MTEAKKSDKAAKKTKFGIAHNLKILMEKAQISEHELSRRTKVKQPIIHRLLSGENNNPKLLTIKPIADYFMLSVSQFIGEKEIESIWTGLTNKAHHGWVEVPLSNYREIKNRNLKTRDFVVTEANVSKSSFAYYIEDQSMEPLFPSGCIVIVDPEIPLTTGHNIIIKTATGVFLRNYLFISGKKFVIPFNNKFGTIASILDEDEILGTVVRTIFDHDLT